MKKLFAFTLSLLMVMSLASVAFADNVTITMSDAYVSDSTYKAYRLLDAEVNTDDDTKADYTVNSDYSALLQGVTSKSTDAEVVEAISEITAANALTFAGNVYNAMSIEQKEGGYTAVSGVFSVPTGYYLIVETDIGDHPDTYSLYLLKVVHKSITVTTKESAPSLTKKVQDDRDGNWVDTADYNIGDSIPYQLTGTMPDKYDIYTTYKYVITDTMTNLAVPTTSGVPTGVTVTAEPVTEFEGSTSMTLVPDTLTFASGTLTVGFNNLKTNPRITKNTKIYVNYEAVLQPGANLGSIGNENVAVLEYSNNPNNTGSTGHTPEDKNIVYTYQVNIHKTDEQGDPLTGATFALYKANGTDLVSRPVVVAPNGYDFSWVGLDAGTYVLKEVTPPTGYNKINDITFTISATHTNDGDATPLTLTELTATDPFTAEAGTGGVKYNGIISADIENEAGPLLPETGGVGTTMFYVIGAALLLGAGVLLISKKRMSAM